MNKQQIIQKLKDTTLDTITREQLQQLLHYLEAEGLTSTTTNKPKHTKHKHKHKRQSKLQ